MTGRPAALQDPVAWAAVIVGLVLRWLPHRIWAFGIPIRDEALYLQLAQRVAAGGGMGAPRDWLWAPGYPYLLATAKALSPWPIPTTVPYLQGLLGAVTALAMYGILTRVGGDRRAARIGAWLYALHPTLVFFAARLWTEAVYGPILLWSVLGALWAREGRWGRAVVPGVLLGLCVLIRGFALYTPPFYLAALLWPASGEGFRSALRGRRAHALGFLAGAVLTVAPYSIHASLRYDTLVIADATLGNLMYLGDNEFEPITFDYGNGILRDVARVKSTRWGRRHCNEESPIEWNRCEIDNGIDWIRENPGEFLRRVPLRVAQLLNPHSFFTRSLRWGRWDGIPFWLKEGLILWICAWSFLVMVGGTVAAAAHARGPYAWLAIGHVAYTVAASAALYGLTRFRLPVEPLWMVFLALALAHPRATVDLLRADTVRAAILLLVLPMLLLHLLWFLPSAWPGFAW